jgi:hypothetical protein
MENPKLFSGNQTHPPRCFIVSSIGTLRLKQPAQYKDFSLSLERRDRDIIYTPDYASLCDRLLLQLQNGLSAVPSIGSLKGMFGPAYFKYTFAVFLHEYKTWSSN